MRLRAGDPPAATLALVAAVAVEEAVATFLDVSYSPASPPESEAARVEGGLRLKWPNDLLLDGAKLAGILLERAEDAVVVGVGMNLAHHPNLGDRTTTSLAPHGVEAPPGVMAEVLADGFSRWLSRWRGEGLPVVRARWLDRAHPLGTPLTVRSATEPPLDGLFDGLDAGGALLLRLASGERRVIHAGDVFLI